MLCPICKKELKNAIFCGVETGCCEQCLGIWFEADELRLAKDDKDRELRWLDIDLWKSEEKFRISPGRKSCPDCRLPLYEVKYSGSDIKVDVCNVCRGIWLDRGEFKKIIEYLKKTGEWEVINNYSKNLKEEFWEIFTGPEGFRGEILDFMAIFKILNYKFITKYPTIAGIIAGLPK